MTDVGSSLIYWDEKEILPRGVFLTSSGSGGDRLLFWQSLNAINDNYKYNLKKDPCTHNGDCSSVVKNANNLDSTSPKDLAFVGSSTMEIIPCPKFKSGSKFRGRKNSENPFALSLISERTMFFNEGTFGNSPITGGLNPNFMGSADRTLNNCSTICSNINSSLCNTSSLSANSPVGSVATNLSNPNIVLGSLYSTDSSLQVPPTKSPLIGNLGISNIEGIPANVLLSLLHQQTQALQRKIYIKLDHSIFIGAAFNLSPSDIETIGLSKSTEDSNTKACDSELSRTTMISFTVGFLMDSSAPPSVLSYLTELSRLINKIYPVCFCLPHKAYCLSNNDGISRCMVAVRPMAIWNAMDKIRPYHALLLLLRKSDLLKDYLPTDINPTLKDFVNALSPTISLYNLAQKFHSQSHCLNLALWLIYRGHALIVYPIVANNIYVLAPHSKAWFTPQLIGQFATSFPDVNFAELLTSFSTCFVLKDHFDSSTCNIDNLQYDADVQNRSSNTSWTNLPLTEKINLIAWLLRRRLIIQIHLYIFPTFLPNNNANEMNKYNNITDILYHLDNMDMPYNHANGVIHSSSNSSSEYDSDEIILENKGHKHPEIDSTTLNLDELCRKIPKDVLCELTDNLPVESQQTLLLSILSHPGAIQNISLLRLFARILPHLPAHLEEIMFKEQIKRSTLVECIERFTPFLATARLPDPVTSCFAGVPWPN
ncbi:GATOR complex protein isoform 2 [Schistosoma japonicum]|uniref:GATOR complex protein NPRL3 n=1 Tax=Schistosoma japonicum TaxID=6182 RepID=A0A4Z2CRC8_SCHJA|nr:GATOR complex protein isoform 2 [Schistosoma japonicum]